MDLTESVGWARNGRAMATKPADNAAAPDLDLFSCFWEIELERAGVTSERAWLFRIGAPLLAVLMLAAAPVVAMLAPDPGASIGILSIPLLLISALPWLIWMLRGDDGPSWPFALVTMLPIAAIGIGQWFIEPLGLGSAAAYGVLAFQPLLILLLNVAYASERLAIGASAIAYLAFTGPVIAAWIAGKAVDGVWVVSWHVVFALAVVAAYTMRLNHLAALALAEAREALAWQAAAEARRQVARDVHDVIAHTLAVTMLHVTAARMAVQRGDSSDAEEALAEAERQGRASLADVRRIVRLLRAEGNGALDAAQPGLGDVEPLVAGYRAAGLPVDLSLAINQGERSPNAEAAIYRVLQEALTNAARYGNGGATVALTADNQTLSLVVGNQVGRQHVRRGQGSGLIGMRERIIAAGGTIETGLEAGCWIVRARIPTEVRAA